MSLLRQIKNKVERYLEPATRHLQADEIFAALHNAIVPADVVLDIGPGLRPMTFFQPKTHIMIEGFKDYIPVLQKRFFNQPSIVLMNALAQDILPALSDKSVDSIFMLDVIEHIERKIAENILTHCERIARRQIVVGTPYGFVEQSYESGESDGWGFAHNKLQDHQSGWTEADFKDGWQHLICSEFGLHQQTQKPYGLLYAIKNFETDKDSLPLKTLLISANVPPAEESVYTRALQSLSNIHPDDLVIMTDTSCAPYARDYQVEDVVQFAKDRFDFSYYGFVNLSDAPYNQFVTALQGLIHTHKIGALLFTDESGILLRNMAAFCRDNKIPALCLAASPLADDFVAIKKIRIKDCQGDPLLQQIIQFLEQSK